MKVITGIILGILGFWAQHAFSHPVTSLYVTGEPDEWVTRGKTVSYAESDFDFERSAFQCYDFTFDGVVDRISMFLHFHTNKLNPDSLWAPDTDNWRISLGSHLIPSNLTTGLYLNAKAARSNEAGYPNFDISANHNGLSAVDGSFRVLHIDIDYSGDEPALKSLAITFRISSALTEERKWLHGTFLYNYAGKLLKPSITSIEVDSEHVAFQFHDLMPGSTVSVERAINPSGNWQMQTSFVSRTLSGYYTDSRTSTNTPNSAFYRIIVDQ